MGNKSEKLLYLMHSMTLTFLLTQNSETIWILCRCLPHMQILNPLKKEKKKGCERQRQYGTSISSVHWEWALDPASQFINTSSGLSIHSFVNWAPTLYQPLQLLFRGTLQENGNVHKSAHQAFQMFYGHLLGVWWCTEDRVAENPRWEAWRKERAA